MARKTKAQKQARRLAAAKKWLENYAEKPKKQIVWAYKKHYNVKLVCAVEELEMLGVDATKEFEQDLNNAMEGALRNLKQRQKKGKKKKKQPKQESYSDDRFAYIVGYTSGGAAYGLTHEEYNGYG